ncbi:MAG: phage terminase large subunit family protein, partial [Elioraea tepidiphila]
VYARAAAAALGMDGWGEGRWTRMADALSLPAAELSSGENVAPPAPSPAAPDTHRPRGWLAPRSGWLR